MSEYADRWSKHYQEVWEERSGDPRLAGWMRVAAYAYGKHKANGHTPLRLGSRHGKGTLQVALATINPETGKPDYPVRQRLHEWIGKAVEFGWLDPASSTRCLIVPKRAVDGGLGNRHTPCEVCGAASDGGVTEKA